MASSSVEVPYNHETENVLFGHNVIEKIADTCLGQDGKRYYQVKWRDSWEPEERLMAACESALQTFWKEYYCNVEKEIRKQVVSASSRSMVSTDENQQIVTQAATEDKIDNTVIEDNANISVSMNSVVAEAFPQQSSMVTYYAVQENQNIQDASLENKNGVLDNQQTNHAHEENSTTSGLCEQVPVQQQLDSSTLQHQVDIIAGELNSSAVQENSSPPPNTMPENNEIAAQADILTQIINAAPGITATKWSDDKLARRTLTTITADTLNTKVVSGPDENSKFHCDICMKTFVSKRNVQRHMLSHTGEKPWMCEFCFKRFRQKPHLEQHVNIHKGIKNSVCDICGKAFNHRSNLVTHMATHSDSRPHACEICGENFKLKHTLSKHMMVHSKQDIEKRHQCKICKKSFRDKSYLAEHETIHHKEKPWQCDVCGKCFSFKRRYQMHLEVHQSKDVEGEYECHLCSKNFKYKIFLQKHLEKHENKRRRKRKSLKVDDATGDQSLVVQVDGTVENTVAANDTTSLTTEQVDVIIEKPGDEKLDAVKSELKEAENQLIQLARSNEQNDNLVVASMLPMTSLSMEDATYVALAQLTQAAVDSAPIDDSGNVILMSYQDIEQTMRGLQSSIQQDNQDENVLSSIQMVENDKGTSLQIVEQQDTNSLPIVSIQNSNELRSTVATTDDLCKVTVGRHENILTHEMVSRDNRFVTGVTGGEKQSSDNASSNTGNKS